MLLEKKSKIKTSELLILLTWLKGETVLLKKPFKFDFLLSECMMVDNEEINVEDFIDQLMIDLFHMYDKLKKTSKEDLEEKMKETALFNILSKDLVSESMRSLDSFIELYERILMETKFEYPEIRGIQKNIFDSLITTCIMNEEYEKCIELKVKIKEV
jgi:hypothetical protein